MFTVANRLIKQAYPAAKLTKDEKGVTLPEYSESTNAGKDNMKK